jgi:MFS family permease
MSATRGRRSVLMVVLLATAMSNLDQSIVGVALPTLRQVFGAQAGLIQWVVLAYQFGLIATLIIAGRVADRIGGRRVFLVGLALFTLASGLCGISLSIEQLIASRGLQGIGAAMLIASGQALLIEVSSEQRRGSAMGYLHMAVAAGLTAGPALGGLLLAVTSWRVVFLVNLPIGILALWLGWHQLPRVSGAPVSGPLLELSVFRSWPLISGLLVTLLAFVALASNMFLMPFVLQPVMGLSPAQAGLVMITVPLTILVIAPLSGRLTDRIGPRVPASLGIGLVTVAILLMAQLQPQSTVLVAVLILIVYGIGAGSFQAPNNTAVMSVAPVTARGMVSGILALSRSLGQIAGVTLASTVWTWRQDVYAETDTALAAALRDALLVLAGVALVAVMLSLLRGSQGRQVDAERTTA